MNLATITNLDELLNALNAVDTIADVDASAALGLPVR